ncbi:unnamed protein product [Lota lota]
MYTAKSNTQRALSPADRAPLCNTLHPFSLPAPQNMQNISCDGPGFHRHEDSASNMATVGTQRGPPVRACYPRPVHSQPRVSCTAYTRSPPCHEPYSTPRHRQHPPSMRAQIDSALALSNVCLAFSGTGTGPRRGDITARSPLLGEEEGEAAPGMGEWRRNQHCLPNHSRRGKTFLRSTDGVQEGVRWGLIGQDGAAFAGKSQGPLCRSPSSTGASLCLGRAGPGQGPGGARPVQRGPPYLIRA